VCDLPERERKREREEKRREREEREREREKGRERRESERADTIVYKLSASSQMQAQTRGFHARYSYSIS